MIRRQMLRNLILGVGAWAMGRTSQAAQTPDLPPLTTPNTQFTTEWVVRLPDGVTSHGDQPAWDVCLELAEILPGHCTSRPLALFVSRMGVPSSLKLFEIGR